MQGKKWAVHVVTTSRTYKGKTYQSHLLRRSYREDGKVKNETVANLTHLPDHVIELVRRSLRGEEFVEVAELFDVHESPQHGHVAAVHSAMRSLRFDALLASRPSRERSLVMAMVAARIISPQSKLATNRWWHTTTIPEVFGVDSASEDDLYAAMDWLGNRQSAIEKKLANRHLSDGGLVLYDLSSSYVEGTKCPLAKRGYSRDRKKGTLQINYGLVTDALGCPVSVSIFPGNTGDSTTVLDQVNKVRDEFGIETLVIVGDRGMISQTQIDELKRTPGVDWVTALKSTSIRKLLDQKAIQLEIFDERNLFEIEHGDYPGERLVACRNPDLAARRAKKRLELLQATEEKLAKIKARVESGRLRNEGPIGVAVGKVISSRKMEKHFDIEIAEGKLDYSINTERVAAEAALDGIYVIRTSLEQTVLQTERVVETYKRLATVERAFRSLKTIDLNVRPIRHWTEARVRAHIFLCMLAYYVQYHMQEAWRPMLFADEEAWTREREDVVARAQVSQSAIEKARSKKTGDGQTVHSFRTLLAALGGIVRNKCSRKGVDQEQRIVIETRPNAIQQTAFELLTALPF